MALDAEDSGSPRVAENGCVICGGCGVGGDVGQGERRDGSRLSFSSEWGGRRGAVGIGVAGAGPCVDGGSGAAETT